jgi:hypothetical protein
MTAALRTTPTVGESCVADSTLIVMASSAFSKTNSAMDALLNLSTIRTMFGIFSGGLMRTR